MTLSEQVLQGKRRAIARLISRIENEHPEARQALEDLFPHTGNAHLVGITGAPGTGKSSLVNELAKALRRQNKTVAIIAVDPTSPFSGGAILGDRIRMRELSGDRGVFIRSMASRGSLGGLARGVYDAIKVFDAAGFDVILIETVGVGQGEVDIARTAHTVLVVEAPGLGDDIQAIKAGILEIADIFVVNKADKPGANNTVAALRAMLDLGNPTGGQMLHHGTLMTVAAPEPPSP
ncbi:MAG TPA: methylmalonyl Co-A mutase-associated GTPase MeaB, partial [Anaerolineae bacterium]|nr:methylmalonyl Co-A mutase-associated GTPase MeaB [Anaerolineae bacterium]